MESALEKVIAACSIYRDLSYVYITPQCIDIRRRDLFIFPEGSAPLNPVRIVATPVKLILEVLCRTLQELPLPTEDRQLDAFVKRLSSYGQNSFCPGITSKDLKEFKYAEAKKAVRLDVPYSRMEGPHCALYYGYRCRKTKFQPVKKCNDCTRYLTRLRHYDKHEAKSTKLKQSSGVQSKSIENHMKNHKQFALHEDVYIRTLDRTLCLLNTNLNDQQSSDVTQIDQIIATPDITLYDD